MDKNVVCLLWSMHLATISLFSGIPLKQKETKIANNHNSLKNSTWREVNQFAIYKYDRGVEVPRNDSSLVVRAGLEPASSGFQVWCHPTTRPRCFRTNNGLAVAFSFKLQEASTVETEDSRWSKRQS